MIGQETEDKSERQALRLVLHTLQQHIRQRATAQARRKDIKQIAQGAWQAIILIFLDVRPL